MTTRLVLPLIALTLTACGQHDPPRRPSQAVQPAALTQTSPAEPAGLTWKKLDGPGGPVVSPTPRQHDGEEAARRRPVAPPEPAAASPATVSLTTELSNSHVLMPGDGKVQLEIALDAARAAGQTRLPMNVALVIDRSGSMRGDKIARTRDAARHFISELRADDVVAIVSYADDVRVDLPAGLASEDHKQAALDAISRIHPGGSTNLSGGLFRGQDEVQRNLRMGQVNRVLLMSDGLANRGITDTRQLSTQAQKHAQQGISVSTLGVGTDYNEDLMTAVADHASGNYYFIAEASAIRTVFDTELGRMFATVAQGASVELLVEDGVELKQVFGYTFTRQGDVVTIPLAEMFGGQKRSILVEVAVPVLREGSVRIGEVTLRYQDAAAGGQAVERTAEARVQVTTDAALVEQSRNRGVEERAAEVQVAAVMTEAADLLREGKGTEAKAVLGRAAADLESTATAMGGSARLRQRVDSLRDLSNTFERAEEAPAEAARAVKKAKADGYLLAK